MLLRPAERVYRTWIIDSRRWDAYSPRAGDIVIATYPKCGTTWMQRILGLLVFQDPAPRPVMQISPWIDRRFPEPVEAVMARIEAQAHRRFLKSHLPADGLPLYDEVSYIHVARDGRDACLSSHNHASGFTHATLAALDKAGLEDESIGRPYPRPPADPVEHFRRWLRDAAEADRTDGGPILSYFQFERSWWAERDRPNVLLVHYNDMKADLAGEMQRVADFLGITVPAGLWPALVEAAGFEAMRRDGDLLMGPVAGMFQGGGARFFHRGEIRRWQGVYGDADVARYDELVDAILPADCARWLAEGSAAGTERPEPAGAA